MRPYEQHIWNLLTRVLAGEADRAEQKKFTQWLEEDPSNRMFFEEVDTLWKEEPDGNAVYHRFLFDYESGISKLRYKIREEKEKHAFPCASFPETSTKKSTGWIIAASIMLLIGFISAWAGIRSWSLPLKRYETSNIEQEIITFPDGSTVRLNKNSTLSFAEGFSGSTRKVTLTGEAFFQVKHDAQKPFVIHTGNAVVRDIGTSFNVKQQDNGEIVVAVKEGAATLRAKQSSSRNASVLTKNQIGILNKGQVGTITLEDIQNYLSWIHGRLVFKDMRFDMVIRQLNTIYGIHCRLADPSLSAFSLTSYTNNTSLNEVLQMIALSLDIKYQKKGKNVVWMKKGAQHKTHPKHITDNTITTKNQYR